MNQISVKRAQKEIKTKIINLRLTPSEFLELEKLKGDMKFENLRDLLLYGSDVLQSLCELYKDKNKFYAGNIQKNEMVEVELELLPNLTK